MRAIGRQVREKQRLVKVVETQEEFERMRLKMTGVEKTTPSRISIETEFPLVVEKFGESSLRTSRAIPATWSLIPVPVPYLRWENFTASTSNEATRGRSGNNK